MDTAAALRTGPTGLGRYVSGPHDGAVRVRWGTRSGVRGNPLGRRVGVTALLPSGRAGQRATRRGGRPPPGCLGAGVRIHRRGTRPDPRGRLRAARDAHPRRRRRSRSAPDRGAVERGLVGRRRLLRRRQRTRCHANENPATARAGHGGDGPGRARWRILQSARRGPSGRSHSGGAALQRRPHLARHGTPVQVQRVCYATFSMFVTWSAYAAWRHTGAYPPAWEYLAARQHDSFYTSMTLVDPVGGYELPAGLYYDPRVRQALMQAGTASVLVNDLHSVAKDAADEKPVCNMVLQVAADRNCSIQESTEITVDLHNNLVRDFEAGHRKLRTVPSPELHRFLNGVKAWMGGGLEWHATNPRYES
ncbi:terpene synthase family protein [Fodinicola feengrottensis]|uniref:terpene synthase family protein n=1 Tax=Fodinicola feengrottensis TaxID=435914 RepID=UPI002442BC59|nr:hypothetical protein [Fodinicola feengrottensis]